MSSIVTDASKSIAFIDRTAFGCFIVTLRSSGRLRQLAMRTLEPPARLQDVHAAAFWLAEAIAETFTGVACAVLFTDGLLTVKTIEPVLHAHARMPVYAMNRSSALAWGVPERFCRFVLVDFSEPGAVALVKRNARGHVDDVRLFDTSVAGMLDANASVDLGSILRVAAGFGYKTSIGVSDRHSELARTSATYHPRRLLHRGAMRAIAARESSPGAWVNSFGNSIAFAMRAKRDIAYEIVQTRRPVYDGDEPALASLVEGRPVFFAVDTNVEALYGTQLRRYADAHLNVSGYLTLDGGEEHKTWQHVERLCTACIEARLPRHGVIVGVGGGIVLDIAGMTAALYRRGVQYIRVATTLLAMIDVAVGIKHGVNLAGKKNIIGTFYPPKAAINDALFLRTNSRRQLSCGVAEAIKIALVADRRLFELLDEHLPALFDTHFQAPAGPAREILERSQMAMMTELASNLFEADLRRAVDFGHSISPSLEACSEYTIAHGEAVAIDMLLCTAIAVRHGLCAASLLERMVRMYSVAGLPMNDSRCTARFLEDALIEVTRHRGGDLNLVVPLKPGRYAFLQRVTELDLRFALDAVAAKGVAVAEAG